MDGNPNDDILAALLVIAARLERVEKTITAVGAQAEGPGFHLGRGAGLARENVESALEEVVRTRDELLRPSSD